MLLMKNYKSLDLNVKNKIFLILIVTLLISVVVTKTWILVFKLLIILFWLIISSSLNKSRYEKWYDCSNVSNTNLYKCDSTWVNDKRYKVTKTYNQGKINGLSGTSYEEMKDYVPNGFECE